MLVIPAGSIEYLYVPVAVRTGDTPLPTAPVQIAVVPANDTPTGWQAATWEGAEARVLLDGNLTAGSYDVWVRVTDTPENVLRNAGRIILT